MLDLLDRRAGPVPAETIAAHLPRVLESLGKGDLGALVRTEAEVAKEPGRAIAFDAAGHAVVAGRYHGGRFEVLRIRELRERALAAWIAAGRPKATRTLWVLDGISPATDIGALQATAAPDSLFQAASQFNCLEAPDARVVPVSEYPDDPTQGPRASVSAFPGALVRHYAAPADDGSRFVQTTGGRQIELLAGVCEAGVAQVRAGYLRPVDISRPEVFARTLVDRFEAIAVGVHDGIEVVLGADGSGSVEGARRIAQVFTSTLAGGRYGHIGGNPAYAVICRQLLRGAYLGTLLAAAALGQRRVCLTLIGGGVFANPISAIWEAIEWASDQIEPFLHRDLSIVVNGRHLGSQIAHDRLASATRTRNGGVLHFAGAKVTRTA